jgi:hypothetical protein
VGLGGSSGACLENILVTSDGLCILFPGSSTTIIGSGTPRISTSRAYHLELGEIIPLYPLVIIARSCSILLFRGFEPSCPVSSKKHDYTSTGLFVITIIEFVQLIESLNNSIPRSRFIPEVNDMRSRYVKSGYEVLLEEDRLRL